MSEETEIDLSEWELASTKKMISYSFGFLLVYFMGGQFNSYEFYYYESITNRGSTNLYL